MKKAKNFNCETLVVCTSSHLFNVHMSTHSLTNLPMCVPRSNSSLDCMTALEFENLHQTSKKQRPGNSMHSWMHAPLCYKRNEDVLLLFRRQRTGCDLFQSSSYSQEYVFSRCGDLQLESGSTIKPHQL